MLGIRELATHKDLRSFDYTHSIQRDSNNKKYNEIHYIIDDSLNKLLSYFREDGCNFASFSHQEIWDYKSYMLFNMDEYEHKTIYTLALRNQPISFSDKIYMMEGKMDIDYGIMKKIITENNASHGLKRVINKTEDALIDTQIRKLLGRFGSRIVLQNYHEINIFTKWLKKYDQKFESHILNSHNIINNSAIKLNGIFIVNICKGCKLYVDASSSSDYAYVNKTDFPILIYFFGKRYKVVLNSFKRYFKKYSEEYSIFNITGSLFPNRMDWTCTRNKMAIRSMDTVFLHPDQKKRIIDHLERWKKNKNLYIKRGITYKTGILLHGMRGTGKSTLAVAIANYMNCDIINIDTTTFHNMNISEITTAIVADNRTYVVLLDEIDCIFSSRDNKDITDKEKENITKLLGFLDSAASPSNVIFIGTTNYYSRLDPAITRKGRFDLIEKLTNIDQLLAREMCKSFLLSDKDIEEILKGMEYPINPAILQDHILSYIKDNHQED